MSQSSLSIESNHHLPLLPRFSDFTLNAGLLHLKLPLLALELAARSVDVALVLQGWCGQRAEARSGDALMGQNVFLPRRQSVGELESAVASAGAALGEPVSLVSLANDGEWVKA